MNVAVFLEKRSLPLWQNLNEINVYLQTGLKPHISLLNTSYYPVEK